MIRCITRLTRVVSILVFTTASLGGLTANAAVLDFQGTRANVNPVTLPGVGRCAPARTVTIAPGNLSSTGMSNLGAFASTQSQCIVGALSPATPSLPVLDGEFLYDFGMGDTLLGTYTGTLSLANGVITGNENLLVKNGTGRFAGAVGFINSLGTVQFGPNAAGPGVFATFNGTVNGRITVDGPASWSLLLLAGLGSAGLLRNRARRAVL